ncbi:hypothetical protein JCM10450v2_006458 [Rhodotorula kratochvilovae]
MQTRAARKAARLPLRLPDDVVLLVIETCEKLEKDRYKTLAVLCRLAKRYQGAAERELYSRVELEADFPAAQPVTPGTPLYTLVHVPRLRPNVKSVQLDIERKHAQDAHVWGVLQDLPNVEEITLHLFSSTKTVSDRFLGHGHIHLRGLSVEGDTAILRELMQRHPAAFAALTRLDLQYLPDPVPAPHACTAVTSLSLKYLTAPDTFATFTSTFSASLTSLSLPLGAQLASHTLASFQNLKHLSLFCVELNIKGLEEAIPCVKALLATAASLPSFVSLAIEGALFVDILDIPGWGCNPPLWARATPQDIPSSSEEIFAAIPSQVQHLSLITSFFRANDVAAFLLGADRPPGLRTLRLGGGHGQGFKEFAGTKSEWYADFERTMEDAGVEVTTMV